jgi:hypothetical protein
MEINFHLIFRYIFFSRNSIIKYLRFRDQSIKFLTFNIQSVAMQSVPITTKVVIANPVHGEVYSMQLYVIESLSVTCDRVVVFSGYSGFLHQ